MVSLIVLPEWLITSPLETPRQGWGIRFEDDKVVEVAPNADLRGRYPTDEIWEAPGQVLAPGFVDAHTHLYGVLAHGIPLDKAPSGFWPFLEDFWWPLVENRLDLEMICAATDIQTARMVQSAITSFYDCQEAPNALPQPLMGCLDALDGSAVKADFAPFFGRRVPCAPQIAEVVQESP